MTENEVTGYKSELHQMKDNTLERETIAVVSTVAQSDSTIVQQEQKRLDQSQKIQALFHEWRNRDAGDRFIRAYNAGLKYKA